MAEEHGQVREEQLDPEREARRRLALAQIRQYPDPVLRMRANDVESFDDDLRRLVERMKLLMRDANGVGLAGTQVGTLQRVFVLQPTAEDEPRALVNPVLVDESEETVSDTEGCLSLQGVTVPVERPLRVTVEAKDENGADVRLELEEHPARVAQHELDHLDGILIIDRTTADARREALGVLRPEPVLGAIS
jgi:peptide deformylase